MSELLQIQIIEKIEQVIERAERIIELIEQYLEEKKAKE